MTSPTITGKTRAAAAAVAVAATMAGTALWPAPAHASPAVDWYQASASGPTAGEGAAMAYDPDTGDVVLFGGEADGSPTYSDQTWVWDGTDWTQQAPAHSPAPRVDASMAYDSTTGQLVLFGGLGGAVGAPTLLSDTWTWDGTDWTQQTPTTSPPARWSGALSDDPSAGQLVLFGGADGGYLGDTWTWDGTDWTQQTPTISPGPRVTSIAYHDASSDVVLFGGFDGVSYENDTWLWDGFNWIPMAPAHSPVARMGSTLTDYPTLGVDVLFGGGDVLNGNYSVDTWIWDGTDWIPDFPADAPPGRSETTATFDQGDGHLVLFGGFDGVSYLTDTWLYGTPPPPPPVTPPTPPAPSAPQVTRLQGADRDATAAAISRAGYPAAGSARAVVLARDDVYTDALVGGPLAAHVGGPLLLTPSQALSAAAAAEIRRALPAGATVYLLGGQDALSAAVADAVTSAGHTVERLEGPDRYATAVAVADALGDPGTTFVATGDGYPDALAAGPAAAAAGGAVLLSDGTRLPPSTAGYLGVHHGSVYAVGGPACQADPDATCVAGADRYATAVAVATTFAAHPGIVGVASGAAFPDATAGGAYLAARGGALLLAPPDGTLPAVDTGYLESSGATDAVVFGGAAALPASVDQETLDAMR